MGHPWPGGACSAPASHPTPQHLHSAFTNVAVGGVLTFYAQKIKSEKELKKKKALCHDGAGTTERDVGDG
ncbi:hypothetical protein [Pseudomonas sp. NPDC089734]|uniref:hypothetical protein n=1 Tax=Pseudomonas sp. NPDC089734 TaxID=3364469 RepID=UPI0037F823E6